MENSDCESDVIDDSKQEKSYLNPYPNLRLADRWLKEKKYSLADLETSAALQAVICNTPGMNASVLVDDLLYDIDMAYSARMFAQEEDDAVLTKEDVLKGVRRFEQNRQARQPRCAVGPAAWPMVAVKKREVEETDNESEGGGESE